jgi:cytochrome c peroxidase
MRRTSLVLLCVVCLVVLGAVMITRGVSAQNATSAIYFPYPTGIIPSDLVSEIARVNREVSLIESEALTQWNSLPKNSGTAMRQVQLLGKIELFDKNLSVNKNQACSFCHMPASADQSPR